MATSVKEFEDEMRRRGLLVSEETVLAEPKTTLQEFQNFGESVLKGSARGVVGLVGGWGNLYDYLTKNKGPSALSSSGIMQGLKDLTGIDINKIPGYSGAYEFSAAAAPAAALTAAGVPGLFGRTVPGVAGEFGVAGSTGLLAQTVAPESPLAQLAIQSAPYAAKGVYQATQRAVNAPSGLFPSTAETQDLLRVGRMTPGELGQGRTQLATEARVEAAPASGQAPVVFRQGQALDVEKFVTDLFERSAGPAVSAERAQATAQTVSNAFNNFGKALSGKLRSDANRDFKAAKGMGGLIDTAPVVDAAKRQLSSIAPEEPGFATLKQSLDRIINEYEIPATPATTTPSAILGPTGQPASVTVTPAAPASVQKIDIKRLQDNLAIWGDAAYSGQAKIGGSDIFQGVAPGKAKGIALDVLRGFKQSLDNAIDSGVPGAEQLVQARNNFRDNIKRIEEFSDRPLTKTFGKPVSELVPEQVIAQLKALPATQQKLLAEVMQNSPSTEVQALFDTVRRSRLDEVLAKGEKGAAGAAATDPAFNVKQTLKALQANGDLARLFPSPKDLQDAQLAVQFMQRTLSKEAVEGGGGVGSAYTVTRGAGGTASAGFIAKELASLVQSTLTNPAALSKMLFEGDNRKMLLDLAKKKSFGEKAYESVKALGKNVGVMAVRGGPALDVGVPEQPEMVPASSEEDVTALEAEMRRRKLME